MRRRKQYEPVRAPLLAKGGWNDEAGFFGFGLPIGWRNDPLLRAFKPGEVLLTGVSNHWTDLTDDGPFLGVLVLDIPSLTGREAMRESEQIFADPDGLAQYRAGFRGEQPIGRPARILLDGSRAVLLHYAGWNLTFGCWQSKVNTGISEVFTLAPGGRPLLVMYGGIWELHQRGLPELFTMLGTWKWLTG
jgi:hypothetical protein